MNTEQDYIDRENGSFFERRKHFTTDWIESWLVRDCEMYPSNPHRKIKLFYDPDHYPTTALQEKLLKETQNKPEYRNRTLVLSPIYPEDLYNFSISPFYKTEQLFLERKHVTEIEGRSFGVGTKTENTVVKIRVVARNFDAFRTNSFYFKRMLDTHGASLEFGLPKQAHERDEVLNELLAHVLGKRTRPEAPIRKEYAVRNDLLPTVSYRGLLLGALSADQAIYPGILEAPKTALKGGGSPAARERLFRTRCDLVSKQLKFELSNAYRLFGANRYANQQLNEQTQGAILTWFSQVIIAQRRVAWRSQQSRSWAIAVEQLVREQQLHGDIAGLQGLPHNANPDDLPKSFDTRLKKIGDAFNEAKAGKPAQYIRRMSLDDRILAALHGSAIDVPDMRHDWEHDFREKGYQLIHIASWIGSLKRTGRQVLDDGIAAHLSHSRNCLGDDSVLLEQFDARTWSTLFDLADTFIPKRTTQFRRGTLPTTKIEEGWKKPSPISVDYEWVTDETLDKPRCCTQRRRTLLIRGPMLCFPTNQRQSWIEKSATIRELDGFEVLTDVEKKRRADARRKRLDT